jgi:hypothetical protein
VYFYLAASVVDRDDLTLQEKMACVVMARYANQQAFDGLLSIDILALKMGVSTPEAKKAFDGLINKGMIERESFEKSTVTPTNILKNDHHSKSAHFDEIPESPSAKSSTLTVNPVEVEKKEVTSDQIQAIFDEVVSKRQALILFELANRDIDELKRVYHKIKDSDVFDVIDALADSLQGIEHPKVAKPEVKPITDFNQVTKETPREETSEELITDKESDLLLEELEKQAATSFESPTGQKVNTQINLGRIKSLYQKQQIKK